MADYTDFEKCVDCEDVADTMCDECGAPICYGCLVLMENGDALCKQCAKD